MNFLQIKINPLPNRKQQRKQFPLLYAVEDRDLDQVKGLIKKRPGDLEKAIPNDGRTALIIAAGSGYLEIVDELLEAHANVDGSDIGGFTALHWAVFPNHLDIAECLIRWNATVDAKEMKGMTPLILASQMGHESLVALLIKSNADVNIQIDEGGSAIHQAIYSKRDKVILQLLQVKSLDVNIKDSKLSTPLHVACAIGSVGWIKPLVKRGANVNIEDEGGFRPLHAAVSSNQCKVVTELLNCGAEIDLETNSHIASPNQQGTSLMIASSKGYCSIIHILLKFGAEIDKKNKLENSCALKAAITRNQVKAVEVLLKAGADPNIELCNETMKYTVLVIACENGYVNIVKLLLDNGAHANPVIKPLDLIFLPPIFTAAAGGHNSIIELLIEKGANVNSTDSTGFTALDGASKNGNFNTVSLLLSRGCDVSDLRPLIIATKNGHRKVVELLIDACPKLVLFKFAIDDKKQPEMCKVKSLFDIATIGQDREMIKILMDRITTYIMYEATEEEILEFMSSELSHEDCNVLSTCVVENKSGHQYVLDSLTETNLVAITQYAVEELKGIAKNTSHATRCLTLLALITCSRMVLLDRSYIKEFESCLTNVKKIVAYGNKEPQAAVMLCHLAVGHRFPKDHINCIFQCKPLYFQLLEQVLDNCNHDLQCKVLEEMTFRIKDLVLEQEEVVLKKFIEKLLEALRRKSSKESAKLPATRLSLFLQNISGFESRDLLSICLKLFSHMLLYLQLKPADLKKSVTVLRTNAKFMEKVKVCCPELLESLNKEGVLESSIANDTIRSEGSKQQPKKKRKRKKKNKQTLESALEGIQLSSDVSDGMQEVESVNIQSPSQISDEEKSATDIIESSLKWTSKRWGTLLEKLNNLEADLQKDVSPIKVCCRKEYQIGKGSDGTTVYVGLMDDDTEVAVKRVDADNDYVNNEAEILKLTELRDPHIVQYKYLKKDSEGEYAYLILELCECTLDEYVKDHPDKLASRSRIIIEQLLKGLKKLHEQNRKVLHRDLKPQNVFVDVSGNIRLADFGISRRLNPNQSTVVTKPGGSRCWRAQETLKDYEPHAYKASSDIQVAGMLVYYILSGGQHPYGDYEAKQMYHLEQGKPNLFAVEDTVAKDLIFKMLEHEPKMRPSAKECLGHPYFWPSKKRFAFLDKAGNQQEVEKGR